MLIEFMHVKYKEHKTHVHINGLESKQWEFPQAEEA
jgi:hypothetical protein